MAKREKAYINPKNVFQPPVNVENKVNPQYINHQRINNDSSKVDFEKQEVKLYKKIIFYNILSSFAMFVENLFLQLMNSSIMLKRPILWVKKKI